MIDITGKETVPSIIAAEQIRTGLARAHTQIANLFLLKEAADGPSGLAYMAAINQAHDDLLTVAQNITYGNEERAPILAAMRQLSDYERLVGMALVSKESNGLILKADALMRERLLPSVSMLEQVNFRHLTTSYKDELRDAKTYFFAFLLFSVMLLVVMVETQIKLYSDFKRILNPPLFLGMLMLLVGVFLMVVKVIALNADLHTAKADAFDSVHSLTEAQSIAYSANAQESIYLLMHGHPSQGQQTNLFIAKVNQIFDTRIGVASALIAQPNVLKAHGFLGDELANITFPGEHQAIAESLKTWAEYVAIDTQIRRLESAGQHEQAVALGVGKLEHQSDWAFDHFVQALTKAIKINQSAFDAAIKRATNALEIMKYLWLTLLFVPLVGSFIGIEHRLSEYRE
ncbi:hypothetical protein [Undibacterium sp. RuRC25W]|uniref:hypothetical protein n=1 Tax=Undibacterium sp. RuRC25W TaxID=3413047 RepID=UPI003BF2B24B